MAQNNLTIGAPISKARQQKLDAWNKSFEKLSGRVTLLDRSVRFNKAIGTPKVPVNTIGVITDMSNNIVTSGDVSIKMTKEDIKHLHFGVVDEFHDPCPAVGRNFCFSQDWIDPTDNTIRVRRQFENNDLVHGTIVRICDDGVSCVVQYANKQGTVKQHEVPAGIVETCTPKDAQDRIVRFRVDAENVRVAGQTGTVPKNTFGYVQEVNPSGTAVIVKLDDGRIVGNKQAPLPPYYLEFGVKRDQKPRIVYNGKVLNAQKIAVRDPPIPSAARSSSGTVETTFKHRFKRLLDWIYSNKSKLPSDISPRHLEEIDTPEKREALALEAEQGVRRVSQGLLNKLNAPDGLDVRDLLRHGKKISRSLSNSTAGIYFRVYSKFVKDSAFKGRGAYGYLGSTDDMRLRHNQHVSQSECPTARTFNSSHYQIRRAAECEDVVQLVELLPSSTRTVRELIELGLFLMFKTYAKKLIKLDEMLAGADTSKALHLATVFTRYQEWASILTHIAEQSFRASGWPLKGLSGLEDGLNISTPLAAWQSYDKIAYTLTEAPNTSSVTPQYYIARVGKQVADTELFSFYDLKDGKRIKLPLKPEMLHLRDKGLNVGVYFDAEWEIYPEGAEHPVPYYLGHDALPWDNLKHLRRLGLKLTWDGPRGRVTTWVRASRHVHGAEGTKHHGLVTGLMAFFLGDRVVDPNGHPLPHVRNLGTCQLIDAKIDRIRNTITLDQYRQAGTTRIVRRTQSLMRTTYAKLKLENAGRGFASLDQSGKKQWLIDQGLQGKHLGPYLARKRKKCDRCTVISRLFGLAANYCDEEQNGQCSDCNKWNLDCTWTSEEKLFREAYIDSQRDPVKVHRPREMALINGLYRYDYPPNAEEAMKVRPSRVDSPGEYRASQHQVEGTINEADLEIEDSDAEDEEIEED